MNTIEIQFGKQTFAVQLTRRPRRQLSITVHPDATVSACAPLEADIAAIRRRLSRRAAWIARQVAWFQQFETARVAPRFVCGETHRFLGRQYRLRVSVDDGAFATALGACPPSWLQTGSAPAPTSRIRALASRVALRGAFFEITVTPGSNAVAVRRALQSWMRTHATALFQRRLALLFSPFKRLGVSPPTIHVRAMRKRWGSCSPTGQITLNLELLKTPLACIDYVIVHELCHLVRPSHDATFVRILQRVMPDWGTRKSRLEHSTL